MSDNPHHIPVTITRLTQDKAVLYARDIVGIYRDSWFATYPNPSEGITVEDIQSKFADLGAVIREWEQTILPSPVRTVWIAENEDDEVVGFCVVIADGAWHELEYLYIHPSSVGKGIGDRLMGEALAFLGHGQQVVLFGAAYNRRAQRFYEKHGFVRVQEPVSPKVLPNGKGIPGMKMVKAAGM